MAKEDPQVSKDPYMTQYDGVGQDWISSSALQTLEICGLAYEFKYIQGLQELKFPNAIRGTATHFGRQINLEQKIQTYEDLDLDTVTDATANITERLFRESEIAKVGEDKDRSTKDIMGETLDDAVRAVKEDYLSHQRTIQPKVVEKVLAIRVPGLKRAIVGKIDTIDKGEQIRDLKTTKTTISQQNADESEALTTYGLMYRTHYGREPGGFVIDNVVLGKVRTKSGLIMSTRTPIQYRQQLLRFRLAQNTIDKGAFTPCPQNHWKCSKKYCGFWHICPLGGGA